MKTNNDATTNQTNADKVAEPFRKYREKLDARAKQGPKAWVKFQRQAEQRAQTLEAEALATRLVAMAEDPQDVVSFLFDLSAFTMNAKARELARFNGNAIPPAYVPASRLLTRFDQLLAEKMATVVGLLDILEHERIELILPGFLRSLESNDPLVQSIVLRLISMTAEDAALWIRQNLDGIEARFVQ